MHSPASLVTHAAKSMLTQTQFPQFEIKTHPGTADLALQDSVNTKSATQDHDAYCRPSYVRLASSLDAGNVA